MIKMRQITVVLKTIFKYLLPTIITVALLLFYLIYTSSGQKNAYSILSYYASHKSGLDIKIKKINLHQFPFISTQIVVEKLYHMDIEGFIQNKNVALDYTLQSKCIKSNYCRIDDNIAIKGHISGWRKNVNVTGKGDMFGGTIDYQFTKQKHTFKDIDLNVIDINSTKLASLLGQKAIFNGKANAQLHFDIIEEQHRSGHIIYDIKDHHFHDLDVHFHANIHIKDKLHTFAMNLSSDNINLNLTEGKYNLENKIGQANYTLDIKALSKLHKLLGGKYLGAFHGKGKAHYKNKKLTIEGVSHDLDGELHYLYDTKSIELTLKSISLQKLMDTIGTKALFTAKVTGNAKYLIDSKEMNLQTKLKQTKILPSKSIDDIEKKFDYNLTQAVFDQSAFSLIYKNKHIISSDFTLANHNAYIKLKNSKINEKHNSIDTYIDIKTPKHTLEGKLFLKNIPIEEHINEFYIKYDGLVESHYHLKLDGMLSDSFINLDYDINAHRLPSGLCTIVDDINISGHATGSSKRLHIAGSGKAMEGIVNYSGIKIDKHLENVSLRMKDIHALKLFTLLGLPDFPSGKADVNASFTYLSKDNPQGILNYYLKKGTYKSLPIKVQLNADVNSQIIHFDSTSKLSSTDINITKGIYHLDTNTSKAFYTLYTKELNPLEPLIGSYYGSFTSTGEIQYHKQFRIRGISPSFGGIVDYLYKNNMLYIDLENVMMTRLLTLFHYPHLIDATLKGSINYDYNQEKLLASTKLVNTKFLNSDLVQTVYKKSGVNMLKESFPLSTLNANYQHKILTGNLTLKSKKSHFYLNNVHIDKNNNRVHALFDLSMQEQAFSGKISGTLKNPKVDLNMQKLLRYQMDKQLDSVMGKSNRKLMEAIPMGGVAKDMASEVGGGFLDMFF